MHIYCYSSLPFFFYLLSLNAILYRVCGYHNLRLQGFRIYYLNNFCANSVRYTRQLRHIWPPSVSK